MTFEQYFNQTELRKTTPNTILVPEENSNVHISGIVDVYYKEKRYRYLTNKHGALYTLNESGDKKSPSVFKIDKSRVLNGGTI